jgi:HEAT repeat protein
MTVIIRKNHDPVSCLPGGIIWAYRYSFLSCFALVFPVARNPNRSGSLKSSMPCMHPRREIFSSREMSESERMNSAAVPALTEVIRDENAPVEVWRTAVFVLRKIGPGAAQSVPALLELARNSDDFISRSACFTLGDMGPLTQEVLPQLTGMLSLENRLERINSSLAFAVSGRNFPKARPHLRESLNDEIPLARIHAASYLVRIGEDSNTVLPILLDLARGTDMDMASSAISQLELMGPDAEEALPSLIESMSDVQQRVWAAQAIRSIRPDTQKELLETIKKKLDAGKTVDGSVLDSMK